MEIRLYETCEGDIICVSGFIKTGNKKYCIEYNDMVYIYTIGENIYH